MASTSSRQDDGGGEEEGCCSSKRHERNDSLVYTIHNCSSYSGEFTPDRILVDSPTDPRSRWLSDGSKTPQYITVKLVKPAVLLTILFGKYEKSHACNLRRFAVYGGMDHEHMYLLCEGGLSDNSKSETFPLRHEIGGQLFSCQYVKLIPLQSWGGSYSIWYLQLNGDSTPGIVDQAQRWLTQYRRKQALRLCMKHLRECEYGDVYQSLTKHSKVELEHPLLTQLHSDLVVHGDFPAAEKLLEQALLDGHLDQYISQQPVQVKWSPIITTSDDKPGMRGGHQMCMDSIRGVIYLFGGWNGTNDLCDLWRYTIQTSQWECLCTDSTLEGGPSGRSCHKMCLDQTKQKLYILGRYLSPSSRTSLHGHSSDHTPLPGDMYSYNIREKAWQLLSSDTNSQGGPHLLHDHQMTFDLSTGTIYVFGGRVLTSGPSSTSIVGYATSVIYSGLYSYATAECQWTCLRPDYSGGQYHYDLIPRMAHSLLLHPVSRKLYIISGQRNKSPLGDMLTFDLQTGETEILANGRDSSIPAAGFTIRTSLDTDNNEILLLMGLNKFEGSSGNGGSVERRAERLEGTSSNSIWIYSISDNTWTCMLSGNQRDWCSSSSPLPPPRYAHQFVSDYINNSHYMFGGNLGNEAPPKPQSSMRLDDFWRLKLVRQTKEQLLRKCKLAIRKQQFNELTKTDEVKAISYLQKSLSTIVDHTDGDESTEFRELTSDLFSPQSSSSSSSQHDQRETRYTLFQQLSSYFPECMAQPRGSVLDMVKF